MVCHKDIKNAKMKENQKILCLEDFLKIIPTNKIVNIELKNETIKITDCPEIHKIIHIYKNKFSIIG